MKNFIFYILIAIVGLSSCSSNQKVIESPSFVRNNDLPNKPSFAHLDMYSDFYMANPYQLDAPNNILAQDNLQEDDTLNLKLDLKPVFSIQTSQNYFGFDNRYGNQLWNNNLSRWRGSYFTSTSYFSQYSNGNYWGSGGVGPDDGTNDFHIQKLDDGLEEIMLSEHRPDPIHINAPNPPKESAYCRPMQGEGLKKGTKVTYQKNYSFNHISKQRSLHSFGNYHDVKRPPVSTRYYSDNPRTGISNTNSSHGYGSPSPPRRPSSSSTGHRPSRTSSGSPSKPTRVAPKPASAPSQQRQGSPR